MALVLVGFGILVLQGLGSRIEAFMVGLRPS